MNQELYHHGILGMKWGVRRWQNKDGSLTPAGKKRYDKQNKRKQFREDWKSVKNNRLLNPDADESLNIRNHVGTGQGSAEQAQKLNDEYLEQEKDKKTRDILKKEIIRALGIATVGMILARAYDDR